jgi:type IV pilus assembly protein PilB
MAATVKRRMGDILVEMDFIGRDQLEMAAVESRKLGIVIGEVLVRLGWISREQLQIAIAIQSGAKRMETEKVKIDPELVAEMPGEFVSG